MIAVHESGACMGAVVSGMDLSEPLPDAVFDEIREDLPDALTRCEPCRIWVS